MKRTDLVKNLALKIRGQMQQAPVPSRFGAAADAVLDKREQRKRDQAAGLVPFAVKLHNDLIGQLRDKAAQDGVGLNELTARLIQAGLDTQAQPVKEVAAKKVAAKVAAKKVAAKNVAAKKVAAKKVTEQVADKVAEASGKVARKAAPKTDKSRK